MITRIKESVTKLLDISHKASVLWGSSTKTLPWGLSHIRSLRAKSFAPVFGFAMPYPRATEIRSALIDRVDEFTRLDGRPISAVGRAAVNDPHFIFDVRAGHNFTVSRYQRVHDWLDRNWPERERRARNGSRAR